MTDGTLTNAVDDWVRKVKGAGYEPLISFNHSLGDCDDGSQPCRAPDPRKEYLPQIKLAVKHFQGADLHVTWYTAWNEPNNSDQPTGPFGAWKKDSSGAYVYKAGQHVIVRRTPQPAKAAGYWNEFNGYCMRNPVLKCYVALGDFIDSGLRYHKGAKLVNYVNTYRNALSYTRSVSPPVWAIHAYRAGRELRLDALIPFVKVVANGSGAPLWLTEQGAVRHRPGFLTRKIARVDMQSRWLVDTLVRKSGALIPGTSRAIPKIKRFYYYQAAGDATWDSGLFSPKSGGYVVRHAYCSFLGATTGSRAGCAAGQ